MILVGDGGTKNREEFIALIGQIELIDKAAIVLHSGLDRAQKGIHHRSGAIRRQVFYERPKAKYLGEEYRHGA